jgi:hypothetical protein
MIAITKQKIKSGSKKEKYRLLREMPFLMTVFPGHILARFSSLTGVERR